MWTWSDLLALIGQHPGETLALAIVTLMAAFIGAGLVLAWREACHTRRRDDGRRRLEAVIDLSNRTGRYPPPPVTVVSANYPPPKAPGMGSRRVGR